MKAGLVVNPIAGMGGRVGLKGTDGLAAEAVRRGARPISAARMAVMIASLRESGISFLTASGDMGETVLENSHFDYEVVYEAGAETTAEDTKKSVAAFLERGASLIIFCGGDGTARDVLSVVGEKVPILGVPAGVKMHSSVFAVNPAAAAEVVDSFVRGEAEIAEAEVMDIDEEAYRKGTLSAVLYGIALVPSFQGFLQGSKESYGTGSAIIEKEEIAAYMAEQIREERDVTHILGAGTTLAAIARELDMEKTLLGVDIYRDGVVVAKDASERDILANLTEHNRIIITPIGQQGFIFGRGTQQISPEVIKRVELRNITVVATPTKLRSTPVLRADTGDRELDMQLKGYMRVVIGYGRERMVRVE